MLSWPHWTIYAIDYQTSLKKEQDKDRKSTRERVYEWVGEKERERETIVELKLYLGVTLFQVTA